MASRTHHILLTLILVFTSLGLFAQIPNGYYNNANGKTGDELKIALHNIIKGHTTVSYNNLISAYAYTDCKPNGKIWDMYSNYEFSLGNTCGSYQKEGDCYNREHLWCQSWFNDQSTPRCDLHQVVPTDGYVNNRRSNYPFGEVRSATYTSGNGSKLGSCSTTGYSGTVFEPIDEYKGDIARSLFYVSVRYYNEDSGWASSGMTSKSTILPWAMTMLLRWSDEDPVSQKEIDRNNAVYGYQHNRNPFIDNPEYAHMIWDTNWHGTTYSITCNTPTHGSISASPTSAYEGQTITLTATPEVGYILNSWTVTDANNHIVTVTNGHFTMPAANVTVNATFTVNNIYYTVSLNQPNHGSISASPTSALSGQTISLSVTPDEGYSLNQWYVNENASGQSVTVTDNHFVMPAANVTVTCSFRSNSTTEIYEKVTSAPSDWTGDYLIVYEKDHIAFDGSRTTLSQVGNYIQVSINNQTIEANNTVDASRFIIGPTSGGKYYIKSASGYYIGRESSSNGFDQSATTIYSNSLSMSGTNVNITGSGGPALQYYNGSNSETFKYYKSNQQSIQLYRRNSISTTTTHTINFHGNGGTSDAGDPYTQILEEGTPTPLSPNSFTRQNFRFDGWNTEANGLGTYYVDEASIVLYDDIDLYAMWEILYPITCASVQHGSISADRTSAIEDEIVSLTAEPAPGYSFSNWTVTDAEDNEIPVFDDQFTMPASAVTISATFVANTSSTFAYVKVTSAPQDWSGNYLIVYESERVAFNGALNSLDANHNNISVTISHDTIEYDETTSASSFNIALENNKYTIQSASGYYIGTTTTSNSLTSSTSEKYYHTISLSSGNANIVSSKSTYLRYNKDNTAKRFRYYGSGQQPIQLYRRVETSPAITCDITYSVNGHTSTTSHPQGTDIILPTPTENIPTGFTFAGWTAIDNVTPLSTLTSPYTVNADTTLTAVFTRLPNESFTRVLQNDTIEISTSQILKGIILIDTNALISIKDGGIWTIDGKLTNTKPASLVIEDGGQLVHTNDGVAAVLQKDITGYGEGSEHFYLISEPCAFGLYLGNDSEWGGTDLASGDYDLYYYHEPSAHWINQRILLQDEQTPYQSLNLGTGYLYANKTNRTIAMEVSSLGGYGLCHSSFSYSYGPVSHESTIFPGFNLVGNPLPCNAYLYYQDGDDLLPFTTYFKMNAEGNQIIEVSGDTPLSPLEGAFIQYNGSNNIYFSIIKP